VQHVWFSAHNRLRVRLEIHAETLVQVRLAPAGGHANGPLLLHGEEHARGLRVHMRDPAQTGQAAMDVQAQPAWVSGGFRRGVSQHSLAPAPGTLGESPQPDTAFGYWIECPALDAGPEGAALDLLFTWSFSGEAPLEQEEADFDATIRRWREMLGAMPLPEGGTVRRDGRDVRELSSKALAGGWAFSSRSTSPPVGSPSRPWPSTAGTRIADGSSRWASGTTPRSIGRSGWRGDQSRRSMNWSTESSAVRMMLRSVPRSIVLWRGTVTGERSAARKRRWLPRCRATW